MSGSLEPILSGEYGAEIEMSKGLASSQLTSAPSRSAMAHTIPAGGTGAPTHIATPTTRLCHALRSVVPVPARV